MGKSKKKNKTKSILGYVAGSAVLCTIAVMVMPKLIETGSSTIYNNQNKPISDNDDWGPKIVRKNEIEE